MLLWSILNLDRSRPIQEPAAAGAHGLTEKMIKVGVLHHFLLGIGCLELMGADLERHLLLLLSVSVSLLISTLKIVETFAILRLLVACSLSPSYLEHGAEVIGNATSGGDQVGKQLPAAFGAFVPLNKFFLNYGGDASIGLLLFLRF